MICKAFPKCGGCKYLDLSYKKQIGRKKEFLERLFGFEIEIIPSPRIYYHRNRMDYAIIGNCVGLRERGKWWSCIDIKDCLMLSPETNIILERLREFMREFNLSGWNFGKQEGDLRYIVIREGKFTGKRMVTLVLGKKDNRIIETAKKFARRIENLITTFYIGINDTLSDTSYSYEKYLVFGEKYLKEKLLGFIYNIGPNSFFQTNSYTAEILIKKVLELADPKGEEIVYDMYSGVGTFSVAIGNYVKKVIGVEIEKESIELYKTNMIENEIHNFEVIHSRVEKLNKVDADIFIFDPPRSGLNKKVLKLIIKSKPKKIIYVSCNPKTQKRDIDEITKFGYKLEYVVGVDQFPHTDHIETIALLKL